MERIVQAAQNDFEEGGYAPETLQDLKKVSSPAVSDLYDPRIISRVANPSFENSFANFNER